MKGLALHERGHTVAPVTGTYPNPPWLAAAVSAAGDLPYEWDLDSDRLTFAGRADLLFGAGVHVMTGDQLAGRINPEDLPVRLRVLAEHMAGRGNFDCEYRVRDAAGQVHWVHDRGACRRDADGRARTLIGVLRVVTQRKRIEAMQLNRHAFDELTGHFSRSRLAEALEHALEHAKRHEGHIALLAVGIDGLSAVEDARGPDAADRVIVEVGRHLDSCLRATDVIGRLGSDSFGVVLMPCPADQLRPTAEKVLGRLATLTSPVQGAPEHRLSAAAGAAALPEDARTASEAMTRAEAALAEARRRGRGQFVAFVPTEAERAEERRSLAAAERMHRALREGGLSFAYQPIVRAETLVPAYHECLLRLSEAGGAPVSEPGMIVAAERLGDIPALDRKTLDMAIDVLEQHHAVTLSVNLSGLTVSNRAWLRALNARLRLRPDLAKRLVVEITETAAMRDIEESARFIAQVRDLGVRVALDDFGAGFTSFRHLKALAVDIVKIDSSFCAGVAENADNQLFLRSLGTVARGFSLACVAEGPASDADEAFLRGEGIQYFQGNRYGAPTTTPPWG